MNTEIIRKDFPMTQEAIQEIIRKQRNYFYTGATLNIDFRITALKRLQTSIQSHQEQINAALKSDLGKSSFESYMCESGLVLSEITYMLKHIRSLSKEKTVHTPLAQFHSRSYMKPSPYGVTLIMSPWNYPFLLTFDPLVDAIAAGNTAVLKPSAYSPATSNIICEIVRECFPEEYVAVVMGGRQENSCLLQEHFDYIFFTGSVDVGKMVMEKASRHLTPVTLELGGKSPVIVDRTANLPLTARRLAFGKILNAGQTCVAPDYCLVDRTVRDRLVEELKKQFQKMLGEDPLANRDFVRIINRKHYNRLQGLLEGENLLYGGGHRDDPDSDSGWIAPTLVADTLEGTSKPMGEEIFGPILPIIPYDTLDQAIDFIRQREKPLALYLFTQSRKTKERILNTCSFGGGCVNDTIIHLATSDMGFGGVGESGMGSYHGKLSFDTFTHYKSIVKKSNRLDLPVRYQPYTKEKERMLRRVLK